MNCGFYLKNYSIRLKKREKRNLKSDCWNLVNSLHYIIKTKTSLTSWYIFFSSDDICLLRRSQYIHIKLIRWVLNRNSFSSISKFILIDSSTISIISVLILHHWQKWITIHSKCLAKWNRNTSCHVNMCVYILSWWICTRFVFFLVWFHRGCQQHQQQQQSKCVRSDMHVRFHTNAPSRNFIRTQRLQRGKHTIKIIKTSLKAKTLQTFDRQRVDFLWLK